MLILELSRSSNVTLIPDALIEQEVCRLINCMIHKYGYATFDEIFKLLNKDKFFINLIEKMIKNEMLEFGKCFKRKIIMINFYLQTIPEKQCQKNNNKITN